MTTDRDPILVQVRDPETNELLQERVINNDYCLVTAGTCHLANITRHANGTIVLTIKSSDPHARPDEVVRR